MKAHEPPPKVEAPPVIQALLRAGERLHVLTNATEAVIAVTDDRLLVTASDRVALDIPFEGLRRIQFDIERSRPATLVIVPEHPRSEPQVLSIPPAEYPDAARVLAVIGERLARTG